MKRTIIAIVFLVTAACDTKTVISEGDRVGIVTKFSHKLMSCGGGKTWNWEGELAMQGGTIAGHQGEAYAGDGMTNQSPVGVWQFSIDPKLNPALAQVQVDEVRQAMNHQLPVRVGYTQTAYHDCDRESDYMVSYVAETAGGR